MKAAYRHGKELPEPTRQGKGGTRSRLCQEPEGLAVMMDMSHSDRSEKWARNFCKKWVWATPRGGELCPVQCETEKKFELGRKCLTAISQCHAVASNASAALKMYGRNT